MNDPDRIDLKFRFGFVANLFHFSDGHGAVSLVLEIQRLLALGIIADNAFKNNHRAV